MASSKRSKLEESSSKVTSALLLQDKKDDGCTWYRLTQFEKYARQDHEIDTAWLRWCLPEETMALMFDLSDVFVTRLDDRTLGYIKKVREFMPEKPIIVDIDDNYDDISPLSDHYAWLGTEEVKLDDGQWLWKDGNPGFNLETNRKRVKQFKEVLEMADVVTVTTFPLRNYAMSFNPNVAVIPNAIDFRYYPELDLKKDKKIDIVWSGGSSHYEDLAEIAPTLKKIMEEYPQVHYHHVGNAFPGIIKNLPKDRVHTHGWLHPEAHGYRLTCLNADIGLCPLTEREFNTYKSSIKYYEYSAAGMATVAKNISPYMDDIKHDSTGLLYSTQDELYESIKSLIEDPIKRMTIAADARRYVKEHRDINTIASSWADLIKGIKNVRKST